MCIRTRRFVCLVAVSCVNLLNVGPGFAEPITMIRGTFPTINPPNGLNLSSFEFQNGQTDADQPFGVHSFQSLALALGSGTPAGGDVTITTGPGGSPVILIAGLANWDVLNPGMITIDSDTMATATADLRLKGIEDSAFDWSEMETATLVYRMDAIHIEGVDGAAGGRAQELRASWPSPAGAKVTGTFVIIGTAPEPGSLVLAGSGVTLLAGIRLLRRRRSA
jgi:hypothetical protein